MLIQESSESHVLIDTPAKVNLFLEVLNRRADGYHNINSLFVAVSLFDTIRFTRLSSSGFELTVSSGQTIPTDRQNLIYKAWELMSERFGLSTGLAVTLTKRIPVAAGLGGGSSDASATILACNRLFGLGLTPMEMAELSAETGSDCPFFFSSGAAVVSSRGDILENIQIPSDFWLVLVKPELSISTPSAYASLGRGLTNHKPPFKLPLCRTVEDLAKALKITGNDFEPVQYSAHPELVVIRDQLVGCGVLLARMSGSGPTMFGLFGEEANAHKFADFKRGNWQLHTVRPISLLGEHQKIGGNRGDNGSKGDLT